jgi:hypothetical protein
MLAARPGEIRKCNFIGPYGRRCCAILNKAERADTLVIFWLFFRDLPAHFVD